MYGLDVRGDPAVDRYPDELARIECRVRWSAPELPDALLLPWSDEPVVALDRDEPWLYGPAERDPTARDGQVVVPRGRLRALAALARRVPQVQRIAVAHQLDPDGPVAEMLPDLRRGPRTCSDEVARAVLGPVPRHPVVRRALRGVDGFRRAADVLRDPIVLGIVGRRPPVHGDVCLWIPLTAWRW